ncbi:phosphoglucosamine mutase [Halobacteriovorax marinus]|uniref:Phosphoglucosamine mutase n=1 Tax=Halobacteriovorax marinus TaxID=97084 RepID=A0A1Y5FJG4_9BACT|nr:phosphoglucosamine mutase [Halobacteriovorax marinus]
MSERKLFGTDGIRGKANIYPMTPEVATALGRAVTHYFQGRTKRKKPLIIVGKDTRLSCYMFEQAFAAGVCSQGGEVILTGPLPTPGVAFVTESMRADAGVMISASHNHYSDNGIKIFDSVGHKLPDEVELQLEELVLNLQLMPVKVGGELGNAKRLREVFGRYLVHVKSTLSDICKLDQMRIVLDCANGAGYRVAPMMFDELGAEVMTLGVDPNGQNINSNCGSLHPEEACEQVKKYRADLGVCLDGDADRVTLIDDEGVVIEGDALIGIFAKLLLDTGRMKKGDTVVGTVMSNLGLENYVKSLGLKFHRTKVGDRYIVGYMRDNNCILGGEPSGHVIFGEYATTGDGCLAALKAIEAMKYYNKSIRELASAIDLYPHLVKNVVVKNKVPLEDVEPIQKIVKEIESSLGDRGRILLRYSGTESLARVMVEGEKLADVHSYCDRLVDVVTKELGN